MSKTFMPHVTYEERIHVLQNNADKIEETDYDRVLSEEELEEKRRQFFEGHKKLDKLEKELNTIKTQFKGNIDPLKSNNKVLLDQINTGKEPAKGLLYHMANHDDSMMETYDKDGIMIESRRLMPNEKRRTLFIPKAANE